MLIFILIVIALILLGIYSNQKTEIDKKKEVTQNESESLNRKFTEEEVFAIQEKFETQLKDTFLPDAISGKEIYVYRHLMSVWYKQLSSANRYNEAISQKLRFDWVDYMESLKDASVHFYLFNEFELENKEKAEKYLSKSILENKKVSSIEDAFADMMGKDSVAELTKIKAMTVLDFDENGNLTPTSS